MITEMNITSACRNALDNRIKKGYGTHKAGQLSFLNLFFIFAVLAPCLLHTSLPS